MKRNAKAEKHREFLRLRKKLHANWEAQSKLGYKPLEKPILHGYDAYWVLRDDVARRVDADKFQYILDNFGVSAWCKKRDFKVWNRQLKREEDINPHFREIDQYRYDKLSPWVQKFFYSYQKQSYWGGQSYTMYAVNIPSHFIVRKVVRSYKTHYKVIDGVLKQEEAEIESQIDNKFFNEQRNYWERHRSKKWIKKNLNRVDRAHNKSALRKNMGTIFAKYDDINDDWGSWLSDWCDDFYEFKYNHKHRGSWWM